MVSRILVVDPSLLDRQRIRLSLEAAGHQVVESDSPGRALEMLRRLSPGSIKLVVTELEFPDGDGESLVREAKADPKLEQIPFILVTPQPSKERIIQLISGGVSTIVTKPFSGDLVLRRVTESLADLARATQGEGEVVSWTVQEYLRRELKRAERSRSQVTIVVVQVLEGTTEQRLMLLMRSLLRHLRESDLVVRLGEGQIAVILPETDMTGGQVVEARIRQVAQQLGQELTGGTGLEVEVTVGRATYPTEAGDASTLLALARDRGTPLAPVLM